MDPTLPNSSSEEIYESLDFNEAALLRAIATNNLQQFDLQYNLYKQQNQQQIWTNKLGNNVLQIAVSHGAKNIIHHLLQNPDNRAQLIDARNHKGQSVLHFLPCNELENLQLTNLANYQENIENIKQILQMLIAAGCKINAFDENRDTVLHFAASKDAQIIALLIEFGAKIDAENKEKATPLHIACVSGKFAIVDILIKAGANIEARDINGLSALHYAAAWEEEIDSKTRTKIIPSALVDANKVIDLLLQQDRALISAKDKQGHAALHLVAQNNQANIAQHLLANGANIVSKAGSMLQKFRAGHNPLYLAAKNYSEKTVDVMLKFIKAQSCKNKDAAQHYTKFLQENIAALKDREKSRASSLEKGQEKSYDFLIAKMQKIIKEITTPNLPPVPTASSSASVASASAQQLSGAQNVARGENIYQ